MASSQTSDPVLLAGKYRLEEVIGTGGMGTVYRATHILLQHPVAVKVLKIQGADPLLAERFLREARVAAAVRHPNVVDIVDFGTTPEGQPFMVMEFLEGMSLWQRMCDTPPLTVDQSVQIIAQVLLGLDAVHRAGIIHRDLKPANIFVSPHDDGSLFARLLDFGISYSIDPDSHLRRGQFGTDERLIVGTPEYLSPEQAEGRPDVDVRGDVYAIGVILYELLTDGLLPYSDPNPGGVLFKVMSGGHVPLARLRPDLPELAQVVDAALSFDRDARPATARDLRRMLLSACGLTADLSGTFARISDVGLRTPQPIARRTPLGAFSERPTETTAAPRAVDAVAHTLPGPTAAPPASNRGRWVAGLAVVALALGGALAFSGLTGSSAPPPTEPPAPVPARAAEAPVEIPTAAAEVTSAAVPTTPSEGSPSSPTARVPEHASRGARATEGESDGSEAPGSEAPESEAPEREAMTEPATEETPAAAPRPHRGAIVRELDF